jgi:hypothetical protein
MAGVSTVNTNLTVDQPNRLSIGDMLNIARGAQEYRQAQELNPIAVEEAKARLSTSQTGAEKVKRTLESEVSQAKALAQSAEQSAESGGLDLKTKKQKAIAQNYVTFMFDPDVVQAANDPSKIDTNKLVKKVTDWGTLQGKETGIDEETTKKLIQPYIDIAQNDPSKLQSYLKQRHILGVSPEQVKGEITPTGIQVSNNQQVKTVNTNPFAANVEQGAPIPGTQTNLQLPVGTEAVSQAGDNSGLPPGTKYIVGTNNNSALATSTSPEFQSNTETMKNDIVLTNTAAQAHPVTKNIINTIKQVASEALTGPGADKKSFAIKLGESFGMDMSKFDTSASATDILKKESAMLQSQGNTDAAKAVLAMATPNYKMTYKAIQDTANQLYAQSQLSVAKQKLFNNFTGDPNLYAKRLSEWNSFADPKILEYKLMDRDDQLNYFAKLGADSKGRHEDVAENGNTKRQNEFRNKLKLLNRLNEQYQLGL